MQNALNHDDRVRLIDDIEHDPRVDDEGAQALAQFTSFASRQGKDGEDIPSPSKLPREALGTAWVPFLVPRRDADQVHDGTLADADPVLR